LFLVNFKFRKSNGSWKTSASAIYQTEQLNQLGESQSLSGSIDTRWQHDTVAGNDYAFSLRADHQQQDSIGSSFQAKTHRGTAGFTAKHNIDANSWEYTGSMSTRFAATASGIYLGGKRSGNSGFVVKVEGPENSDNLIEVKMNGSTKASIRANTEVFIPAGAYRTYDISFSSSGTSIESIDYKGRPMTLYPGNVVPVQATLTQVLIGIGRVILRSGEPLQNALIKGVEGLALTDGNGLFQAEMATGTKQLTFAKGGAACTIRLPEYQARRNVARLGKLICDLQ
jgi:outer membrane usher protein FimD/PapC